MSVRKILATAAITALATAVVAAVVAFYYSYSPADNLSPKCLFRLLTGYDCPGCGAQRALHAMLHGRVAEAWRLNPFLFFAVPAAVFFIVAEWQRRRWPRLYAACFRPWVMILCLAAISGWWIGRNIVG